MQKCLEGIFHTCSPLTAWSPVSVLVFTSASSLLTCFFRAVHAAASAHYCYYVSSCYRAITCVIHSDINTGEMHGGVCVCLSAPAFCFLVGQRWGRVSRLAAVTKQKRVGHRTSCAPSLRVRAFLFFPLIFCKLIVRPVLDTMQYAQFRFQKTEEPLCSCLFADVRTGLRALF